MSGRFWNVVAQPKVEDPSQLIELAKGYFNWATDNPLIETKAFAHQGTAWNHEMDRVRAFTIKGFMIYSGLTNKEIKEFRLDPNYVEAMEWIDNVIYQQKFEYAAVDMLNSSIIARDIGLADKREVSGRDGGPIRIQSIADQEALIDEARRLGIDVEALGLGSGEEEEGSSQ